MSVLGIGAIVQTISGLASEFIETPKERREAEAKRGELVAQGNLAQISVNAEEAKSASLFVSGWRPFVGWVCGAACAWNWMGLPMAKFVFAAVGHPVELSASDLGEMMPLLMGLLGMATLRTAEKIRGAEGNR